MLSTGGAPSIPTAEEWQKVFVDMSDVRDIDLQSPSTLVAFTSLAFLVPAFLSWRTSRIWHTWLFTMMSLSCGAFHVFTTSESEHVGTSSTLTKLWLHRAYRWWPYFCFLQIAFLVLGPEDPQLQLIVGSPASKPSPGLLTNRVPWDVVLVARAIPLAAFIMFNMVLDFGGPYCQNMLLTEVLLIFCTGAFWLDQKRRSQAPEVLLRFKFWQRLLHHGLIPVMVIFWIFCMIGFTDPSALHSMLHICTAVFAANMLKSVQPCPKQDKPGTGTTIEVLDTSAKNPNIAHVLTGSVALIVLPTAIVGASYDWCFSGDAWVWPTIASAMTCQPGTYFIAIVALPAYTATAAVFWMIEATELSMTRPTHTTPFPTQPWKAPLCNGSRQRALGKQLGCWLGYAGAACGLVGALAQCFEKGAGSSAYIDFLNLVSSALSLGFLTSAATFTALFSDPTMSGFQARRNFTLFVCAPLVLINTMLNSSGNVHPEASIFGPSSLAALVEYIMLAACTLWPITWAAEVQEDRRRRSKGAFSWPTTAWRFD